MRVSAARLALSREEEEARDGDDGDGDEGGDGEGLAADGLFRYIDKVLCKRLHELVHVSSPSVDDDVQITRGDGALVGDAVGSRLAGGPATCIFR